MKSGWICPPTNVPIFARFPLTGVYVDDLLIVHTDRDARDAFVSKMAKEFDFTDQGTLTEVLGIEIKQTDSDITLCHT